MRGAPPFHVDGHRHVHAEPPVLEALLRVAGPLRLRVRALDPAMRDRIRAAGARACDAFLGRRRPPPLLDAGAPGRRGGRGRPGGATEIMIHPGRPPHPRARPASAAEREIELAAATDPRVREAFRTRRASLLAEFSRVTGACIPRRRAVASAEGRVVQNRAWHGRRSH